MTVASFTHRQPAAEVDLPALIDAIERWLDQEGVPHGAVARLMIAFDEVLSNITHYGGGTIDLTVTIDAGIVTAVVVDDGPPFDPLARPAPDTGLGIDERAIGGLGIHLVREMMDDVRYAYDQGRNRLTFSKTF